MAATEFPDGQSLRRIESVQRAVQLLRLFVESDLTRGLSVTEAARRLAVGKSTVSRLMATLAVRVLPLPLYGSGWRVVERHYLVYKRAWVVFLTGFLNADDEIQGRPVGVAVDRGGALLVADDVAGIVWRVAAQVAGQGR